MSLVFPIWKLKGSASDPDTWRPISLFCTLAKLFLRILLARDVQFTAHRIRATQWAYQKNKSVLDPLFLLLRLAEQLHNVDDQVLHALFLDFWKAFDRVSHEGLEHAARRAGIDYRLSLNIRMLAERLFPTPPLY